ncbi:MAG: hypothetical protein Q7R76_01150 [Candidatus Woesearchaeota archaeon]|nr:hypothetical protein [Candidatus Woesearchaeota archaeon]
MQPYSGKKGCGQFERFLAIFMCVLILTLPFYTANVFAISFQEVHISGGDGKESFRKETDATTIRVKIDSPSPVLPTFLEVMNDTDGVTRNSPGTARFSQCTTTNPYECSVTLPINKIDDKDRYSVCVNLANVDGRRDFPQSCDAARPVAQQNGNQYSVFPGILVDKLGPTVQHITPTATGVSSGTVNLTVAAVDTTGTSQQGCVGVAKIKLFTRDGQELVAQDVEPRPTAGSACAANNTVVSLNADALPNGASTQICAVPQDAFGNIHSSYVNAQGTLTPTAQNCVNITKDNRAPEIENFTAMDAGLVKELSFVANRVVEVKVVATILTHTHLIGRVNASVASFNAGEPSVVLNCAERVPEQRDEQSTDHRFDCVGNAQLNPDGDKTRNLFLSAEDAAKNHLDATKTLTFQIDDVPPAVREITATRAFGGVPVLGPASNTLIAVIDETGAGVSKETVLINNKNPEACIQPEAGAFLCNTTISGVQADRVLVTVRGKDLADNQMEPGSADILVDHDAPRLVKAQIISSSNTPVLAAGGTAILRLIVQENIAMADDAGTHNAVAVIPFDAENPSTPKPALKCQPFAPVQTAVPAAPVPSSAQPTTPAAESAGPTFDAGTGALVAMTGYGVNENLPNLWQCDWEIFNLGTNKDFRATFTGTKDIAGNALVHGDKTAVTVEDPFLVYTDAQGHVHELAPQDWLGKTVLEGLAPSKYTLNPILISPIVDARGAAVATTAVFFDVQINPDAGTPPGTAPVAVDVTSCSGEDYSAGFFAQDATKVMFSTSSPNTAKLRFNLRPGKIPETKTKFVVTCEFSIMSKNGNKVSGVTKATAVLEIPLGNVKDISDGVWDEIVDHVEQNNLMGTFVTKVNKVITFLTSICSILQGLTSVGLAIAGVHGVMVVLSDAFPILKPAEVALGSISGTINKFTDTIQKSYAQDACDFLTCTWTPTGALFKKFGLEQPSLDQLGGTFKEAAKEASSLDPRKQTAAQWTAWANPRGSLYLSYLTMCIPGIFENLQRRRVIECSYISCLYNQVGQGMPKSTCDRVYQYETCKVETGELLALIPFAHIQKQIGAIMKQFITNPMTLATTGMTIACKYVIISPVGEGNTRTVCNFIFLPFNLLRVIDSIRNIIDTVKGLFNPPADACEDILNKLKNDPRFDEAAGRRSSGARGFTQQGAPQQSASPSVSGPAAQEEVRGLSD